MLQLGEYAPPIRVVRTCMGDFPLPARHNNQRKLVEILRQVKLYIKFFCMKIFVCLLLYWILFLCIGCHHFDSHHWSSSKKLNSFFTILSQSFIHHPIHHPTNWPDRPSIHAQRRLPHKHHSAPSIILLIISLILTSELWSDLVSLCILGVHVRTYRCLLHSVEWFSPPGSWRLWGLYANHCRSCGHCGAECADSSGLLGTH